MHFLLALIVGAFFVSSTLAAEPVYPPGSRIGLAPPPGMTVGTTFQGFEDRARGAMIVVSEFSVQSYENVMRDLSPDGMKGMELVTREKLPLPGGEGLLVVARATENGVAIRKWALLALADDLTAVVIATLPETAREAYPDAAMRAALGSVMVRDPLGVAEMSAVLPYKLGDFSGFRLLRASPDGTAVLTLGPFGTTLPVEQPYFMIAPRGSEPPPAERERFAQRMLTGFAGRPNLQIVSAEQMRIGGVPGHEIVATSRDERTGDEFMLVQWLRFSPGVVQMFGIARKDQWADVLPRMRALRDGFQAR